MIIRTAEIDDLDRLRDLLSSSLDIGFDVSVVAGEKLFGPGYGGPARCRIALEDDAIRGVAVTSGSSLRLLVVEPTYRHRGLGSDLLDDAMEGVRGSCSRITVGAAAGNYLVPGVPATDAVSISFLRTRGFEETARATDMIVELTGITRPGPADGIAIAPVTTFDDELASFLEDQFGRAIAWEIGHGLLCDGAIVRLARSSGKILGFTACEINNTGLGTFGPQGVHTDARGRGIGRLLLLHSLADLREKGYSNARIPWVSSTEYYASTCGANVAGEYVVMRKEMENEK